MIKKLSNATALVAAVVAMALALLAYSVWGVEPPKQFAYVLLFGVAVGISISWAPAAINALKRGASDDNAKIILTIWLSWLALIVLAAYANLTIWLQRPDWLIKSPASLVVVVLMLIAGSYALVAPATGEDIPKREKIWSSIATGIGGAAVGVILTLMAIYGFRDIFG